MMDMRVTITKLDGDVNIYTNVTSIEFGNENTLSITYTYDGEDHFDVHLLEFVASIRIEPNHGEGS